MLCKVLREPVHEGSSEICLMSMSNIYSHGLNPHVTRKIIRKSSVESHLKGISSFDFPSRLLQVLALQSTQLFIKVIVFSTPENSIDFRLAM